MRNVFGLPNRTKIINELTRRYDEVVRIAERGIHNDDEAQQFISILAHYVYYVKKTGLTQEAVDALFAQQELLAGDKALIDEAEKIIPQMKKDRNKLVRYARSKNINVDAYEFREGMQQITGEMEFSFYLSHLDSFLNLPEDQQLVSQVPNNISQLLSLNFVAQNQGGETRALKQMRADYQETMNEYSKKLKMQGVTLDFMRVEDYKAIEQVWKEVYQEGSHDELLMFHLMYGDLFEKNRNYQGGQIAEAKEFVAKHITHLQRVQNYLIDSIEDVPRFEQFTRWTAEHFGPTFVSLVLIIIIFLVLKKLGVDVDLDTIKSYTGL